MDIDTSNDSLVSVIGDSVAIMRPRPRMTKEEALRMAAWIVALCGGHDAFDPVLEAVEGC